MMGMNSDTDTALFICFHLHCNLFVSIYFVIYIGMWIVFVIYIGVLTLLYPEWEEVESNSRCRQALYSLFPFLNTLLFICFHSPGNLCNQIWIKYSVNNKKWNANLLLPIVYAVKYEIIRVSITKIRVRTHILPPLRLSGQNNYSINDKK